MTSQAAPSGASSAEAQDRLSVGTLRYTMAGLIALFMWLMWGDFCYTVMEYVNLRIIPLKLKEMGAGDLAVPVILTTIPSIINFVLNPVISTASDRYRGRMGRRRPFLLLSAPLISGSLVLMAFADEIGVWVHATFGQFGGWSAATMAVFTIGLLLATFKVFDMLVNTTFWYFFNDVVPQHFMARFMGLFRVVGSTAAMLFNYFVYEHSLTHMRAIYLSAAAIYFVGFSLMVLMVKEGEYPPPAPITRTGGLFSRMRQASATYVRECLSHRVYWFFFLHGIFFGMSNAVVVYQRLLDLSLGIDLHRLATMDTAIQFIQLLLCYPAGALADRFHPLRVMVWMKIAILCIVPLQFVWLLGTFTPDRAYHITIGLTAIDLPVSILYGAVGIPLMMRIFPRDQFGQFCSFNALCGSLMNIGASFAAGLFMMKMRDFFPDDVWGKDFCYRLMPAWRLPCLMVSIVFLLLMLREWKRLGGDQYTPPSISQAKQDAQPAAKLEEAAV